MLKIETERADIFDINMMITMEVLVTASYTEQEMIDAFNKAVQSYEILNSKVIIDEAGIAYYTENEKHKNSLLFSSKTLEELINEQEKIRFHVEEGEFLRVFASKENDKIRFTFMMNHLGGDGKSLLYFIESFFRSLNNEKLSYNKIQLLTNENIPKECKLPMLAKLLVKSYNKKWQKEKRVFTFEDLDKAYNSFWSNHKTITEVSKINREKLQEKLQECKEAGIGYTSYDIACRIKDKDTKQDVGLAVSARLDDNRTMSNQATGISVEYKYDNKKSLIENAKVINSLMKQKLNNMTYKFFILRFMSALDPTLVDAINLEFAGAFHSKTSGKLAKMLGYGGKTKDLSITNLTKIDIPVEYGKLKINEVTFVPPVVSYGKTIIGMVTANDTLVTAVHYYSN